MNRSLSVARRRRGGFTLVEVLIVISIIAILASLSLAGLSAMRMRSNAAASKVEINMLNNAVEQYYSDEGRYPGFGEKLTDETNQFPMVFNALLGERAPKGPGGRSAPYCDLEQARIAVVDEDADDSEGTVYRQATRSELRDPKVEKYYLDHFQQPYIYRCNRGQKFKSFMRNDKKFDLYSLGPNGTDETMLGDEADGESDDIGNW